MIHSEQRRASWRAFYHRHKKTIKSYAKARPELRAFIDAKRRCINPKVRQFNDYGGRGIRFLLESYHDIIQAIGKRPSSEYSLDRIDNDGDYVVGNIRWATRKQQTNNRRKQYAHG